VAREYEVPRSCFKIDIATGEISQRADLLEPRIHFGACSIGLFIYAIGGKYANCERFNISKNYWQWIPSFQA